MQLPKIAPFFRILELTVTYIQELLMMFEMEDTFSLSPLLRQDLSGSADLHQHHKPTGCFIWINPNAKKKYLLLWEIVNHLILFYAEFVF